MSAIEKVTFEQYQKTSDAERQRKRYDGYFAYLLGHTDAPPNGFRRDAKPARERAMFESYIARRGLVIGRPVKR